MIAFTILGLLFFWFCCWHIGYLLAMYFDVVAKWDDFMQPYVSEVEVLIRHLDAATKKEPA